MRRVVIFAHYDRNELIADYVVYYLKELKKISEEIIFVSCQNIKEKYKLKGLASHIIDEYHNEYDFGSFKRGFFYLENRLDNFDEIVFANDSCYGPLYSMKKIFNKMANKKCDFWGITKNNFGINNFQIKRPHVQSYFVTLKKQIFTQKFFIDFMKSIKHEETKDLIISNYEIGLTELLVNHGFKYQTLVNAYENISNPTLIKWRELINNYNMPFIKKSLFDLKNTDIATIDDYKMAIKGYPVDLITLPRPLKKCIFGKKVKYFLIDKISSLPAGKREETTRFLNKNFHSIYKLIKD